MVEVSASSAGAGSGGGAGEGSCDFAQEDEECAEEDEGGTVEDAVEDSVEGVVSGETSGIQGTLLWRGYTLTMRIRKLRYAGAGVVIAASSTLLTACALTSAPPVVANPPTMAPEQSVSDACAISRAEVDAVTKEVKDRVDRLGQDVTAGKTPDLDGIVDTVGSALERISDGVTNPEVLAALDDVRVEIDGLGAIDPPESLVDAPTYIGTLTSQLAKVQAAGTALKELCAP